jgi:oligosaccharide repeat unit polymerase
MKNDRMEQKLKIKRQDLYNFFFVFLYKLILDLSYYFVIFPVFGYMRFELNFNSLKLVESYLLLFIIFILMPKSSRKLSNVMVWLLVLISYVPMLTLFAFMDQPRLYMYAVTGFWLLVFLLLKIPMIKIPSLKESQAKIIRYLIFFSLLLIVFLMLYKYFGFSFSFDLTKVYEIRAKYKEINIPLAGYLFNWMAYIVGPIFFVLFLTKRKWIFVGLIVVLQLFLFSKTGNKTFLFILPFVLVLMWIITSKNPLAYMTIGLIGIILLGMFSYWLIDDIWMSSLFTRRTLLSPAQLSFLYHDFFSQNTHTFLSQHRIFRAFLDYPYHLDPPHLIGEVYFNKSEMCANNGIYGDGYMNFGFIGLALWGIFLVIILKLIDSFSRNKNMKITVAAISMPAFVLQTLHY